ncbi:MAG: hypothetical protein AAFX79_04070 [Planctomycetota bacterium]
MTDIGQITTGGSAGDLQPRPVKRGPASSGDQPGRTADASRRTPDRVELSPQARADRSSDGFRPEVVARVREAIAGGRYETSERIEATIDAMLADPKVIE